MDTRPPKRSRADVAEDDDALSGPPACFVRPIGNRIVGGGGAEIDRSLSLGSLAALDDLTLLACLQWLTPVELCAVAATSKAMYVLATWDALYRPHVLANVGGDLVYGRDWRDTCVTPSTPASCLAKSVNMITVHTNGVAEHMPPSPCMQRKK
jgi:hypothetical protein